VVILKHAAPVKHGRDQRSIPAAIEIVGLSKTFVTQSNEPVSALSDVSLSIGEREFTSIVGPSGCGKTTLLRIVGGLVAKSTGDVRIRGEAVTGPTEDVGIVFQKSVLLPWKTVLQNVMVPAVVLGLDKKASIKRARDLLVLVGLEDFENKYPNELSGGMQQRVSIARALLHKPSLLLMDEPFGALDAMTREAMNLELQRISREAETTVLFITHSIQEAVFLGDQVVVMTARPGRIAAVFNIDIPKPRSLDGMSSQPFGRYVSEIRELLHAKGMTH
jgi:NitT/TauT family transport system ATP-binding protein